MHKYFIVKISSYFYFDWTKTRTNFWIDNTRNFAFFINQHNYNPNVFFFEPESKTIYQKFDIFENSCYWGEKIPLSVLPSLKFATRIWPCARRIYGYEQTFPLRVQLIEFRVNHRSFTEVIINIARHEIEWAPKPLNAA